MIKNIDKANNLILKYHALTGVGRALEGLKILEQLQNLCETEADLKVVSSLLWPRSEEENANT